MRDFTKLLVPQPKQLKTLRDLIREHLNHAKTTQADLAQIWGIHVVSARRLLNPHKSRPNVIGPDMIDAIVIALRLDADDARELHWLGALEQGYKIGRMPNE